MKKIISILLSLLICYFLLTILFSCKSSKQSCDAYSINIINSDSSNVKINVNEDLKLLIFDKQY